MALAVLAATNGQGIIHQGEDSFVIKVSGGPGVFFKGSYLVTGANGQQHTVSVEGAAPAEFRETGTGVFLSIQNKTPGGEPVIRVDSSGQRVLDRQSAQSRSSSFLQIDIAKNGTGIKSQRTDAPYGVISLGTATQNGGAPRQAELHVDGSAKFAFVTMTSETGDTEQQLVPVPFTKSLYPRRGWVVSLSAQKAKVTRVDPFSTIDSGPMIQVLDDGARGSLQVSIRVNGGLLGEAETSEGFGIASVTALVP